MAGAQLRLYEALNAAVLEETEDKVEYAKSVLSKAEYCLNDEVLHSPPDAVSHQAMDNVVVCARLMIQVADNNAYYQFIKERAINFLEKYRANL